MLLLKAVFSPAFVLTAMDCFLYSRGTDTAREDWGKKEGYNREKLTQICDSVNSSPSLVRPMYYFLILFWEFYSLPIIFFTSRIYQKALVIHQRTLNRKCMYVYIYIYLYEMKYIYLQGWPKSSFGFPVPILWENHNFLTNPLFKKIYEMPERNIH